MLQKSSLCFKDKDNALCRRASETALRAASLHAESGLGVKCYCTLLRVIMRDEWLVVMTCTSELLGNQGFNLLRVKCNYAN